MIPNLMGQTPERTKSLSQRGRSRHIDSWAICMLFFDLLGDLYTVPRSGGRATRLTKGMAIDVQPVFSRDGRRILFVSDRKPSSAPSNPANGRTSSSSMRIL
jgi:hypothetical protein